ncbi:MAG: class I SAM-dependent methyltransferase [Gallionella sp.]|jgi:SAM-dependent methyltransferase
MVAQTNFDEAVFHGNWARCERIASVVAECASTGAPLSILEIGCGTGEQLVTLARKFPHANLTGIDISGQNIAVARDLLQREAFNDRIVVIQADYVTQQLGSFDIIVSYSTLHLIPASDVELFSKLTNELAPGGVFINVIPFECFFNRALLLVRRAFRACRGRFTDALILQMGKLLARNKLNDQQLREQVIYMYMLPERVEGHAVRDMLTQRYGLRLEREQLEPHTSLAQPRHLLVAYRKDA